MPDYLGDDARMMKNGGAGEGEGEIGEEEKEIITLDEGEIELNPYSKRNKNTDDEIHIIKRVNELSGIKESDTVLTPPEWDLPDDKQTIQNEQQLQVTHRTKFPQESPVHERNQTKKSQKDDQKYVINVNQYANFLVMTDSAAPKDIEDKLRLGMDQNKYKFNIPLAPPKFNIPMPPPSPKTEPSVTMIKLPDIVGCKDKEHKEVVESPILQPERLTNLAIEPAKSPPHNVKIHKESMSLENDNRFEILARVSPNGNSAGPDIRPAGNEMTPIPILANRPKRRSTTKKDSPPRNEVIEQEIEEFNTLDVTPFLTEINEDLTKLGKVLYKKKKSASDESAVSQAADDIIGIFAERYIDFLEKEWKKRRNAWLKRSRKCNTVEEDSVYNYESFSECVADGKLKLQVPFDLPSIHQKKHRPEPEPVIVKTVKTTEEPAKEVEKSWWQSFFGSSEGGQQTSK